MISPAKYWRDFFCRFKKILRFKVATEYTETQRYFFLCFNALCGKKDLKNEMEKNYENIITGNGGVFNIMVNNGTELYEI